MRRFRFWPSVKKSYEEQGEIFFACRRYGTLPQEKQKRIDGLILKAGGEYADALREYLLTNKELQAVCRQRYISENTLRRRAMKFFELW